MQRFFRALGVDYRQWLTLTRTMLKLDLRATGSFTVQSTSAATNKQSLWMLGLFYAVTGLLLIAPALVPDAFAGALVTVSIISFMLGALLLIEFQAVVISPDDYAILAYRPISSRTFFAVKITNVLIYVCTLAALMGAPTVVVYLVIGGVGRALGGAAAILGGAVFMTLALICSYALILRLVRPERLRRALSYLQLVLTILVYGGYAILPRILPMERLRDLQIEKTILLLLYPPSWFASFVDLGIGRWGPSEVVPAAIGVASIAVLFSHAIGRLSLSYAERLAGLTSSSETPRGSRRGRAPSDDTGAEARGVRWSWLRNEARAVALLVRGQFRYDMKFRMAVIGLLPLTGLYIFMSLEGGPLLDPFANPGFDNLSRLGMLHMALIFLPMLLLENLATSESFHAAWVFFATPSDKARMIVVARWLVFFCFIVPYLLFVAAVLAWYFDTVLHAAIHVAVFGLVANLLLDAVVLMRPQLPFAKPAKKGQSSAPLFVGIAAAVVLVMFVMPILLSAVYASSLATWILVLGLAGASFALSWAVRRRTRALVAAMEFSG